MVDVELFGGNRGYLSHLRASALQALGFYRGGTGIDWSLVGRLVFVCKGNICRSPYASARARSFGIPAVSFGLDAAEGAPADPMAARNARIRGLDLSAHRSAGIQESCIKDDDVAIAFEPSQLRAIRQRSGNRALAISLLGIWTRPIRPHIQDPYGRGDRYFQQCFAIIDANVAELARRMSRRAEMALAESKPDRTSSL